MNPAPKGTPANAGEMLKAAAAHLRTTKALAKGVYARSEAGLPRLGNDPTAVSWSAQGALQKVAPRGPAREEAFGALQRLVCGSGGYDYPTVSAWNDRPGATFEEIADGLDAAASLWIELDKKRKMKDKEGRS